MLNGLNSMFDVFVLQVKNSDKSSSFAQLRSILLLYEQRRNQQGECGVPISAINALQVTESLPHFSSDSVTICQRCQKSSHGADRCYFRFTPVTQRGGPGSIFREVVIVDGNQRHWSLEFQYRWLLEFQS